VRGRAARPIMTYLVPGALVQVSGNHEEAPIGQSGHDCLMMSTVLPDLHIHPSSPIYISFLSLSSKAGEHEVNALWERRHLVCTRGSLTYSSLHARILYLTVASGLLYFVFPEST